MHDVNSLSLPSSWLKYVAPDVSTKREITATNPIISWPPRELFFRLGTARYVCFGLWLVGIPVVAIICSRRRQVRESGKKIRTKRGTGRHSLSHPLAVFPANFCLQRLHYLKAWNRLWLQWLASFRDFKIQRRDSHDTSLKKWICVLVVFIAIIPTYFIKCTRTLMNLNSKGPYSSSESEIKFRLCLFTFSIKHEIRHFHVVVVQKRQRNVQKSVLYVCLSNLLFFRRFRCRRLVES